MAATSRAATGSAKRVRSAATESRAVATKATAASAVKAKAAKSSKSTADAESTDAAEGMPVAVGSTKESHDGPTKKDDTARRSAAGSAERSRRAPTKTTPTKKSLVQRVYNTIDSELTKLEKQKGLTSQDRERASRALSQMVNALEKAVEMQREMTKRKTTGAGGVRNKEALAHAEDLRREIAERLERLNRKRAAGRRSE